MKVFVDSSAFIALYYSDDSHAGAAKKISRRLAREQAVLLTNNYIVTESLTVTSQRAGKKEAVELGNFLLGGEIPVIRVDELLDQLAFERFRKMRQKDVSFVDCACFVMCEELGIKQVFSFDKHFLKQGFKLVRS